MRTILVLDLLPLMLVVACLPLRYEDNHRVLAGGRDDPTILDIMRYWMVHTPESYVMRHCIKGRCQVYGHTHCTVRWFPLVESCLVVCCELEEGRYGRV